jgi:RHH-type transcriptional regulator, proline utilization regulon repressor / proline dehydrogenase / delta 1-pyrroline-5-carboxylate dehydrogenase
MPKNRQIGSPCSCADLPTQTPARVAQERTPEPVILGYKSPKDAAMTTSLSASILPNPPLSPRQDSTRARMTENFCRDEAVVVAELIRVAEVDAPTRAKIAGMAGDLIARTRAKKDQASPVESFMRQYDLSSEEGVLLMCVAEALLRIPDGDTADKLISDKLGEADWAAHAGKSDSMFVNAGTWGLMLTGKLVNLADDSKTNWLSGLKRMIGRSGEPVIRVAVRQAMKIMGHQFVMGRTIEEALARSEGKDGRGYRHSFDMLGESALTTADAERYFASYQDAIKAIGAHGPYADLTAAPSISVKLSALHPRYDVANRARVMMEMLPKVLTLAQLAKSVGIPMTIDAEEADRLELSLDIIGAVFSDPSLDGWTGFGLALQAYQRRAIYVVDELAELAKKVGRRLCVRLVKGAYWDSEIKRAQIEGHVGYPVFTRKHNTDLSFLACAKKLISYGNLFYPQFATHNAMTIAAIQQMAITAGKSTAFEFQRLHGMGADMYAEVVPERQVVGADNLNAPCRVYAPVGSHEDLLPYLVRRLLENGANTSFINKINDESLAISELLIDPIELARSTEPKAHTRIPLPINLYGMHRQNSKGINYGNERELKAFAESLCAPVVTAEALLANGAPKTANETIDVTAPSDRTKVVGSVRFSDAAQVDFAMATAHRAQPAWDLVKVELRADALERAADLLELHRGELIALLTLEAGKTLGDGIGEVREAADFCRYYAAIARKEFASAATLAGPTGESNELYLHGRGVFVCISPWNFPLAIFLGQIAAALVTGNTVIAKPAEQTSLVAYRATQLMFEAGIPREVLQLLPGTGASVGAKLCADVRTAGVCFTGSTETARTINRSLAARDAAIATLIAETGGQNALICDSSALPEQIVKDAITGAFGSAGQRCSATRVLFVADVIADRVAHLLRGAMGELRMGAPELLSSDLGPVIDEGARKILLDHSARMDQLVADGSAKLIAQMPLPAECAAGTYFAPRAYEIAGLNVLTREVFGPVLHVIRYAAKDLDAVIDAINASGYGLTLGIHSRIDATIEHIQKRARVGNCYVNRNMVGAVVGVQPFGGEGLSGTGPKAGGPHYLHRFVTERTLTVNTAAVGGNATLIAQGA